MTITAAGYIVEDDNAIWGTGTTHDEAWADMLGAMKAAGVRVLAEGEEAESEWEATTRAASFRVKPATAALIRDVQERGGARAWGEVGGIACTVAEEDAAQDETEREWSGSPWSKAPDEFWVDDETLELVCATSGRRLKPAARYWSAAGARAVLAQQGEG